MIYGSIHDPEHFASPALKHALAFIQQAARLADGRHPLDDAAYAEVKHYSPAPFTERDYEAHREFIDVQAVLEGEEEIHVRPLAGMRVKAAYSPERDIAFYETPENDDAVVRFTMRPGCFLLLFPEDSHKTECLLSRAACRKTIVKLPLASFRLKPTPRR